MARSVRNSGFEKFAGFIEVPLSECSDTSEDLLPESIVTGPTSTGAGEQSVNVVFVVKEDPQTNETIQAVKGKVNKDMKPQMKLKKGNCWRIALIIMWSLTLLGALILVIWGITLVEGDKKSKPREYGYQGNMVALFFIVFPAIIEIICVPFIIYGVSKYNSCCNMFGCIWSGIHICIALFMVASCIYSLLFSIYFACIFAFSLILAKKIDAISKHIDAVSEQINSTGTS